jgi:hypothetical protein
LRWLKDPDSAKFGKMVAILRDGKDVIVCGTVNAKNAMGGYVGRQPFYGTLGENWFVTVAVGGLKTHDKRFNAMLACNAIGVTF